MLYPEKFTVIRISAEKQSHVIILGLMLTTMYFAYCENKLKGKSDILLAISNATFALMSVSLSEQIQFEFKVGVSAFFLGSFGSLLAKIDFTLLFEAFLFSAVVIWVRSKRGS